MKHTARKLLSLVMALAIVLSLVPTAWAEGTQVELSKSSLTLDIGGEETLTWKSTPDGVTSTDWRSDDSGVATVDANGKVTAVAAGSTTITATATTAATTDETTGEEIPGKTYVGTCSVTVNKAAPEATSIAFDPSGNKTLTAGGTGVTVTATVYDQYEDEMEDAEVKWTVPANSPFTTSEDGNSITITPAAVSEVTAAKTVTITATSKTVSTVKNTFTVTINPPTTSISLDPATASVKLGGTTTLTATVVPTDVKKIEWTSDSTAITVEKNSSDQTKATVTVDPSAKVGDKATITATATYANNTTKTATCEVTVANPLSIKADKTKLTSLGDTVEATADLGSLDAASAKYSWSSDDSDIISIQNKSASKATLVAGSTGTTTIKVEVTVNGTTYKAEKDFTVDYKYSLNPTATVYLDTAEYLFSDVDDLGKKSVYDQIDGYLTGNNYISWITFTDVSSSAGDLSASTRYTYYMDSRDVPTKDTKTGLVADVTFTPKKVGTATFVFEAGTNKDATYTGLLTIEVKEGDSAGDITYTSDLGKDVYFDVADFESFWTDKYPKGELESVIFDSVSGGVLYNANGKSAGSSSYYVEPERKQVGLDGMYFSPNSATSKKATTIRISFEAYGSTTATGKVSSTPRTGTIVIVYLSAAASKITYSSSTSSVSLKANDFIAAYKEATGSTTTPTNLTIQFQGVPSNGTLTYTGGTRDVKLTNSNIKSYKFNTKTTASATNKLSDVTYTASGTSADTISYIGYIGSVATFTGEVTFNASTAPKDVRVSFTCYSPAGVALNSAYFTSANSAMLNANYVTLGTPLRGKLVNSSTGATLSSNTAVQISMLGTITYVPTATGSATSVTDSFSFTAYNASNEVVASGTVSVAVSLPANSGGSITNINQFTDIPAAGPDSDWYRPQLTYLINRGMINGKGDGKFGPTDDLTYGEALKFIMNAAGYYETEISGSADWARNYKNTAVQRGWLGSGIDLESYITRDAMAELAARVLGIAPATGQASPFSDSTNTYAIALYNEKIVQGNDTSAKPAFNGGSNLMRREMVCLVYRMYQYSGK